MLTAQLPHQRVKPALPSFEAVEAAAIGNSGIVMGDRVRRFVDLSTIGPTNAKRLAHRMLQANITYIDSPISGTPAEAENGSLTIVTACANNDFEAVQPVLGKLGRVFHVGQSAGLAQTMILVRAMIRASEMFIHSEAVAMSAQSGLAASLMFPFIDHGSKPVPPDRLAISILTNKLDPDITLAMLRKNLRFAVEEVEALEFPEPVASAVVGLWEIAAGKLGSDCYVTSLMRLIEGLSDVTLVGNEKS